MRNFVLLASFVLVLPEAASASAVTGKISRLAARASDGLEILEIDGARSAKPACATYTYVVMRDEKSGAGKSQYAMLVAAFLADR